MKFAVFDHLDRSGPDLERQYEERLRLTEIYEWAGFHAYHVAEHHGTPLGSAPSPGLFLAAVAQRTT
jgi:alkanesulfonate monooxygenase SsuD/methylene tetrahydromethanopterin reductase-like flavin-dependent oxidoreductase (luciferase family)